MQNPDPATPRVAAPRRHDTVRNSIVTSVPSIETARFPALGRHVRNRDIDDARIEMDGRCLIDVRCAADSGQIPHRNQIPQWPNRTHAPQQKGSLFDQSAWAKPKPEADLDVRQTVGGQNG